MRVYKLLTISLSFYLKLSFATTLVMPSEGDIIGAVEYTHPQVGETLRDVGRRYDMGYYEMVQANPHVDSQGLLSPNVRILIPSQFILPSAPRQGLVINLAEYRLYFFPKDDNVVITHPVGIGHEGWSTPVGITKVVAKQINPTWRPTAKVLAQAEKNGVQIPDVFPAGPSNPLGQFALRLGWPTYLIHGTNRADGIGERVSAGCIRMLPEDIEYLFEYVPVGTPVRVINQPVKFGYLNGSLYVESHPPLQEQKHADFKKYVAAKLAQYKAIHKKVVTQALQQPTGVPQKISM